MSEKPNTEKTFTEALRNLQNAAQEIGRQATTLEDSLKLFEEGTRLTAYCTKLLKEAEQKIVKLTAEETDDAPELADRQGEDMGEELSE